MKLRNLAAAGVATLALGGGALVSQASAATYGGITYVTQTPYCYQGVVTGETFVSGTATATRSIYQDFFRYAPNGTVTPAYRENLLVRGVTYNFFMRAGLPYLYGSTYRVYTHISGGPTISSAKTFTFCS